MHFMQIVSFQVNRWASHRVWDMELQWINLGRMQSMRLPDAVVYLYRESPGKTEWGETGMRVREQDLSVRTMWTNWRRSRDPGFFWRGSYRREV